MAYRVKVSSASGDQVIEMEVESAMGAMIEALELLDYRNLDEVTGITIDPQ